MHFHGQPNNPHHALGLSPISSTLLNIPYCLYSSRLGKPPGEVPPGRRRPPGLLLLKKRGPSLFRKASVLWMLGRVWHLQG